MRSQPCRQLLRGLAVAYGSGSGQSRPATLWRDWWATSGRRHDRPSRRQQTTNSLRGYLVVRTSQQFTTNWPRNFTSAAQLLVVQHRPPNFCDISRWLFSDQLKLNVDKTPFVLLGSSRQLQQVSNVQLIVDGVSLFTVIRPRTSESPWTLSCRSRTSSTVLYAAVFTN